MFEVLWNFECPIVLSQREICAHFNEGNLVQFGHPKKPKLWSYIVSFEFIWPKVAHNTQPNLGFYPSYLYLSSDTL